MSIAAYKTEIKVGGVPVATIAAALVEYGNDGRIHKIDNPTRLVMSSLHPVVVRDSVTEAVIVPTSINYLEGMIFVPDVPVNSLEIDYYYIPVSFVGGSKEYSLEIGGDLLDDTNFHTATENNPGFRSRVQGLSDVTVTFSRFDDLIKTLRDQKIAKEIVLIVIKPGGAESTWKASGWFVNENVSASGDVGGLEEESFSYQLSGDMATNFSFVTDYTLAESLDYTEQELLDNYFPGVTA